MAGLFFKQLCINGHLLDLKSNTSVNRLDVNEQQGRPHLKLTVSDGMVLQMDIKKAVAEFKYAKWDPEADPILDLQVSLASLPTWMYPYSKMPSGSMHRLLITMKAERSQTAYLGFTRTIRSEISTIQFQCLETADGLKLWEGRCAASPTQIVGGVKIRKPNFADFSLLDLDRLKNDDKWLSDSHVTLILLDCYRNCAQRNAWGNLKIKLFDTTFWETLSCNPDKYQGKFLSKNNLLDCDFAVLPMFSSNHWRLGIVEKPRELMEGKTIFHVLDSLPSDPRSTKEAMQLQKVLLKHFEGVDYLENRVSSNIPLVPRQPNSKDCGCFIIHFARKFLHHPLSTIAVLKTSISSQQEALEAWGLGSSDLTFVRREIRTLLLEYISKGDAVVEFS